MAMEQPTADPVFEALGLSDEGAAEHLCLPPQMQCPQTLLMQMQMQQVQVQQQMQQQVLMQMQQNMMQQPPLQKEGSVQRPFAASPPAEALYMMAAHQAAAAAYFQTQANTSLLLPDVLPAAPVMQASAEPQVLLPLPWVPQVPLNWTAPAWYQSSCAAAVPAGLEVPSQPAAASEAAPGTPPRKPPAETDVTPEKVPLNMAERLEQSPPMVLKLSEVMGCGGSSPASTCTPGSKASMEDLDAMTPSDALRNAADASEKAAAGQMLLQLLKGNENPEASAEGASSGRRRRRGGRGRGRGAGNDTPSTAASDGESHEASRASAQEPDIKEEQRLAETSRELLRQLKGPAAGASSEPAKPEVKKATPVGAPSRTHRAKNGEPRPVRSSK